MKKFLFILFIINFHSFSKNIKYTVDPGDTLFGIVLKYNASLNEVMNLNDITDPNKVKVGDVIYIPDKRKGKEEIKLSSIFPCYKEIEEIPTFKYVIDPGDTLFALSTKYDISTEQIKLINKLSSNEVYVNQVLLIPSKMRMNSCNNEDNLNEDNSNKNNSVDNSKLVAYKQKVPIKLKSKDIPMDKGLSWPIKGEKEEINPSSKIKGIYIKGKEDEVVSITNGRVIFTDDFSNFGKAIMIQSLNNYVYVYLGIRNTYVKKGDEIVAGNIIGVADYDPKDKDNNKIVFSIWKDDKYIDPYKVSRE